MPLIGPILRKIILSRFASSFAMMYASGITVLDAHPQLRGDRRQQVLEHALRSAGQQIAEGKNLTAAFQELGALPAAGHPHAAHRRKHRRARQGAANVSYFYNREVRDSVARLQAAIQPVLTVVLGLLLRWVMMAVLGPVYDSFAKMKF